MKIGKSLPGWVAAVAVCAALGNAYGAFNVTRNGVTWAGTYEGDVTPQSSTPSWAGTGGGGSASGSSDGTSWTQTTLAGSYLYFDQTGTTWTSLGTQRSIEFRARVTAQTSSDDAFRVWSSDASGYWEVSLLSNAVELVGMFTAGPGIPVDNSTFHIYRLTIDETLSIDQAKLYLDNNPVPVATSGSDVSAPSFGNLLSMGDRSSGGVGGTTSLDYISWTSGAFPSPGGTGTTNPPPPTLYQNGVLWDAYYLGSVDPSSSNPKWTGFTGTGVSGSTDGANWTQTTATNTFLYYDTIDPSWTALGPQRTLEFRAQVVAQTSNDRVFDLFAVDTNGYWQISLSIFGVQLSGSTTVGSMIPINNATFHTYRLTIDDTLSVDKAKLYLDNNPVAIRTSGTHAPGISYGNILDWGDGSETGIGGTIALNFLTWTGGIFPATTIIVTNGVEASIAPAVGITWFASNAVTYQVQSTPNLTTNTVWTNVGGTITGSGSAYSSFVPGLNANNAIYRVITKP